MESLVMILCLAQLPLRAVGVELLLAPLLLVGMADLVEAVLLAGLAVAAILHP